MTDLGAQFLHSRDPNFHHSREVTAVIDYLNQSSQNAMEVGELIPNKPAEKISAYLGFLANQEGVNDGILNGDKESIDRQIEAHVIKEEDVPESYFELQRRIAREQGYGDINVTPGMRKQLVEAVQSDQRASLRNWVEYLGGGDGGYPNWFKFYVWTSVTKLGAFNKEKQEFRARSNGTTAPYPELNREALAYVYDVIDKAKIKKEKPDKEHTDEKLQKLIVGANFGKLYGHAVLEVTPDSPELLHQIEGSWKRFQQTKDPRAARRLSESLQGHGTGWCTAGESTAIMQLEGGDFYVYYTRDNEGKETVPRVAIRMENEQVAEVRGINPNQELEPVFADLVAEKMQELPGGEEYIQKSEDMKHLTELERFLTIMPGAELNGGDLRFLYEIDRPIMGFGYSRDPRIDKLQKNRNFIKDMQIALDCKDTEVADRLLDLDKHELVAKNLRKFNGLSQLTAIRLIDLGSESNVAYNIDCFTGLGPEVAYRLIDSEYGKNGYGKFIVHNLDKFEGLDHRELAVRLISEGETAVVAENLEKFEGLDHKEIAELILDKGGFHDVAKNLEKFEGLDHKEIAERILLSQEYSGALTLYLDKFEGLDHKQVAARLIQDGKIRTLVRGLNKFKGIDHKVVAERLIAEGHVDSLALHIDKFTGLDKDYREKLHREYGIKI